MQGDSIEELFSSALMALMDILRPSVAIKKEETKRIIHVKSADKTTLLVDFLNEVLLTAYNYKEAYNKVIFKILKENLLKAELYGYAVESFGEDIKAITYHEADVKQNKDGKWQTNLVFDI